MPGGVDEISELYDSLDGYMKRHFSYEEHLQKYNKYPGLAEQQKQHAMFLAELAEMKDTLAASGPSRKLTISTKGKLIRWLNHHINTLDREFIDFLKAKQGKCLLSQNAQKVTSKSCGGVNRLSARFVFPAIFSLRLLSIVFQHAHI